VDYGDNYASKTDYGDNLPYFQIPYSIRTSAIKYLASVSTDIPQDDMKQLKTAAICPAEGVSAASDQYRRKISDLFEPTESLRSLGLPILQWPGIFRAESAEGRLLFVLGLRKYPTGAELVEIAASASDLGTREDSANNIGGYR
jgi:hypothetical protein